MSSPESREARQKRMQRQAQGSRDSLHRKAPRKPRPEVHGPKRADLETDRWSDFYRGEEVHDEDYFAEHELDFND